MTPDGPRPETTMPATADSSVVAGSRRPRFLVLLGVAVVLFVIVRALLVETFYVPSSSMTPALEPGDRLLVDKLPGDVHRGEVVVFDGTDVFGPTDRVPEERGALGDLMSGVADLLGIESGEADYVKRVVGLPGDRVSCCTAEGRLEVNGEPVTEEQLAPGMPASDEAFDVHVPDGALFVLGDNRPESADSRAHLGDPGGGMVPEDDVIGSVLLRYWPLDRVGTVPDAAALASTAQRGGP
jgi:signal peptidase I